MARHRGGDSASFPQPPEGAALEAARERAGLSIKQAARMVPGYGRQRPGLSDTRWSEIVNGTQMTSDKQQAHTHANRIASMAYAVDCTPDELREAGRPDAADVLEQMTVELDAARDPAREGILAHPWLDDAAKRRMLAHLDAELAETPGYPAAGDAPTPLSNGGAG